MAESKPSPGKLTLILFVTIVFLLGAVLLLVFGANTPTANGAQRGALLGIGSIILILSVGALIAYMVMVFKPETSVGRAVNQFVGY